jgi:hypothetical protein
MVNYTCPTCLKEFSKKSHFKDHTEKRKNPCQPIIQYQNQKPPENTEKIFNCLYCDLVFSRKDVLTRHKNQNRCKVKIEMEMDKEKRFKLLIEQKDKEHEKELCKRDNEIHELKELIKQQSNEIKKCFNKLNSKNLSDKEDITKINKSIKKLKNEIPENDKKIINNQLMNIIIDKEKKIEELVNNQKEEQIIICDDVDEPVNNKMVDLVINNQIIMCRESDKYINANQLCKAGNKKFNDWFRLDSTKELLKELEKSINTPDTGFPASGTYIQNDLKISTSQIKNIDVQIIEKNNQNTWIHPDLAIQLAQWISPKFALQVSSWIRTLFSSGKVEINLKLKEQESKIKLLQDIVIKKQRRNNYPDKNVIYLITTEDNKNKRIYIIGKAIILKDRLSTYNKTCEHQVIHYKSCINEEQMELVEKMVLSKLDEFREKANRDRFILPLDRDINYFINTINTCVDFFN